MNGDVLAALGQDFRELVFPLFIVRAEDNGVYQEGRQFIGTAFFVTRRGDAITADHLLPKPESLQPGQRLVAVVLRNGKDEVCWINVAATFPGCDLALIKVNIDETKWLQVADSLVPAGTDVRIIGIPSHEVWNAGKEMRLLKGHITLSGNFLELNFPVPLGMSGAPVFIGSRAVVAFATGSVRSEEIEDYEECVAKISNDKEEIRITEVRRVIQYGLAFPFSHLRGHKTSVLDDKTLMQFIEERNRS